jgi:hypothetical protein
VLPAKTVRRGGLQPAWTLRWLALAEIEGLESLNFHRVSFRGRNFRYRENLIRTAPRCGCAGVHVRCVLVDTFVQQRRPGGIDHQVEAIFKDAFPDTKKVADPSSR